MKGETSSKKNSPHMEGSHPGHFKPGYEKVPKFMPKHGGSMGTYSPEKKGGSKGTHHIGHQEHHTEDIHHPMGHGFHAFPKHEGGHNEPDMDDLQVANKSKDKHVHHHFGPDLGAYEPK